MGLVLDNIKYKEFLNDITYKFSDKKIVGIYGSPANVLLDIINGDITDYDGTITLDKELIDKDFYQKKASTFALVESNPFFYTDKVSEEFRFNAEIRHYEGDNKKVRQLLTLVGLSPNILNRNISTLSMTEKYLLSLAISLSFEPQVILFKDAFKGLDHNFKKKTMMIIKNLKEEKKIVIVTSNDTNILYELVDDVILLNNSVIYKSGTSDKIFTSTEIFKDKMISMPYITRVTYLAKSKKIKLSYHKDVRDIIKDIYKHV